MCRPNLKSREESILIKIEHLKNVSIGALLGSFVGIGFIVFVDAEIDPDLKRYGTYGITAIVSLAASALALAGVLANIETARTIENDRRTSDLKAAQSVLPLALTRFIEIAEIGIHRSCSPDAYFHDAENLKALRRDLHLDTEIIEILKDCIRSSDAGSREWLSNIVAHYQVCRSRMIGFVGDKNRAVRPSNKADSASDWIVLRALIQHAYGFARGADRIPETMSSDEISVPMNLHLADSELNKALAETVTLVAQNYSPLDASAFSFRKDQ